MLYLLWFFLSAILYFLIPILIMVPFCVFFPAGFSYFPLVIFISSCIILLYFPFFFSLCFHFLLFSCSFSLCYRAVVLLSPVLCFIFVFIISVCVCSLLQIPFSSFLLFPPPFGVSPLVFPFYIFILYQIGFLEVFICLFMSVDFPSSSHLLSYNLYFRVIYLSFISSFLNPFLYLPCFYSSSCYCFCPPVFAFSSILISLFSQFLFVLVLAFQFITLPFLSYLLYFLLLFVVSFPFFLISIFLTFCFAIPLCF